MLQPVTHIEGLSNAYDNVQMLDDNKPGVTIVRFFVQSEEIPALSQAEIVRKSFVWIEKIMNLGNAILLRRIRDEVAFEDGKWKVKKLAVKSDIRQYPNEWNAFARGASEEIAGTPILHLFRNDPARAEYYKSRHIQTVEQLAACGAQQTEQMGIGAREDVERAKQFLARIQGQAGSVAVATALEEKDRKLQEMERELADLKSKLTQVLTAQIEGATPKAKKPTGKKAPKPEPEPEGIEGLGA